MKTITLLAVLAAGAFGVAACGSDSDSGTAASTGATGAEAAGGTEGLRVGYASALDPNDVADQFGLRAAGAEVTTLNEDSAVIAGLQRDSLDVGNIDFNQAVAAAAQGLPVKIIYVAQTTPEYVFVASPEVRTVADLAGKKVGFQEPGSQTELFVKNIVEQQAPEIADQVEFLQLPESSRRAQAMVAGRLDASPLESINLAALQKEGGYHAIASWADLEGDASKAIGTVWVTTDEKYEQMKPQLTELVKLLQAGYNETYEDKQAWVALAESELEDVDHALLPDVYDIYVERSMYPKAEQPALTPATWTANEAFYRSVGEWEEPQSDDLVAYDLIDAGAAETGTTDGGTGAR